MSLPLITGPGCLKLTLEAETTDAIVSVGPNVLGPSDIKHDPRFRLPLSDDSARIMLVDRVLSRLTYHHTGEFLADWVRVLEPGGRLILSEYNLGAILDHYLELKPPYCFSVGLAEIYGKRGENRCLLFPDWFGPQFGWWGLEQPEIECDDILMTVTTKKRLDYKKAPVFEHGGNYDLLPRSESDLVDFRGYEDLNPVANVSKACYDSASIAKG